MSRSLSFHYEPRTAALRAFRGEAISMGGAQVSTVRFVPIGWDGAMGFPGITTRANIAIRDQ